MAADPGPRFRLLGDASAYVKRGMDVQEALLSEGHSPTEPGWGEEPSTSWGHIGAGAERRTVPTLAGAYQLFYAGVASLLLDGAPPPVDIADAITTADIIEAAYLSSHTGAIELLSADQYDPRGAADVAELGLPGEQHPDLPQPDVQPVARGTSDSRGEYS